MRDNMICSGKKCAKEIPDDAVLCCYCGKKIPKEEEKDNEPNPRTRANGTGSAYKRGKTWTAAVSVPEGEGHVKRRKGGFPTKKAALAYIPTLAQTKAQKVAKFTFLQVYEAWYAAHEKSIEDSTMGCYRAAKNYYKDIYNMPFAGIGLDDLQECMDNCPRGKRTHENMKTLGTLLYKYALPRHISDMNYAQYLNTGDGIKTTRPAFSMEQVETIKNAIGKIEGIEYIYCLIYTGFRPGEMLELERDAYNTNDNTLTGGFKTEAGTDRVITISPKIVPIIRELVMKSSPFIFPRPDGSKMDDDYFRSKLFYPAMAELGFQPIPAVGEKPTYVPYCCRHTFANLMKNVQGSDTDKAALMGHASPEMTKYYQSMDLDSIRAITDKL
jgi:integrase